MGSPGVVEGTQTMKILLAGAFLAVALAAPRPHLRPLPLPRLMLIPGMGTTAMASTDLMAMDTMERGLLMLSPLLRLLLPLRLTLMPGTDTMATAGLMPMDTTDTGLMAMDTTTERGLLMLSPLLRLLLPLRLMLMPGMDTMAMVCTDLMAMDTMDTGPMVMLTGERSKKHDSCQTAAN